MFDPFGLIVLEKFRKLWKLCLIWLKCFGSSVIVFYSCLCESRRNPGLLVQRLGLVGLFLAPEM